MNNNVPKNRFFSRSIQLDLTLDKISIKQLILKNLRETIAIYRIDNSNILNPNQIVSSLSDKVILQNSPDLSSLVYCSAIAFPLANIYSLSPVQVAQELVSLLASKSPESNAQLKLQFSVKVIQNGFIEFTFCDRSIGWWLEKGTRNKEQGMRNEEIEEKNLFPVQYVHDRCCSVLLLGERERLITLEQSDFSSNTWQITNPNLFEYYWDESLGYCYEFAEINLLQQISLLTDYFCEHVSDESLNSNKAKKSKTWMQLSLNLSDACLKFLAACRIFGSVAVDKRNLAIARLGLISIVQLYLSLGNKNTSNM